MADAAAADSHHADALPRLSRARLLSIPTPRRYDGQTQETMDATFRSWAPAVVGYGSHAVLFGPQFANARSLGVMRRSLSILRAALDRSDACLGRRTLAIFRSPAFNFDPVNTFGQQATFARRMRPIVEEFGALFVDQHDATYRAAFPAEAAGGAQVAIRFDRNSAFHYLDAGRYLMAQILLHVLRLLAAAPAGRQSVR